MMLIPDETRLVLQRLQAAGYKAYLAGGCVRDMLLNVVPTDYDVATNASPYEVQAVFADVKVLPTGIKHGTVTVVVGNTLTEVTSFRKDGVYTDSRHPDSVSFSADIKDDAARRDFTVNAMYYSDESGVLDFYGGKADLQSKALRAVGNANERFAEDALRILRALRFAARFGFTIEKDTAAAMLGKAPLLKNIAAERVLAELNGFCRACGCADLCKSFLPVLEPVLGKSVSGVKAFEVLNKLSDGFKLAAFFALYGGTDAVRLISKLKPDKEKLRLVSAATDTLYGTAFNSNETAALAVEKYGKEVYADMLCLARSAGAAVYADADAVANGLKNGSLPSGIRSLAVNGNELAELGIKQGRDIGAVLKHLYIRCYYGVPNEKQALLKTARNYYNKQMKGK